MAYQQWEMIDLVRRYDEGAALYLLENSHKLNKVAGDLKGFFLWDSFYDIPYEFWMELHLRIKKDGGYDAS